MPEMVRKVYVVGFAFSADGGRVALVRKNRPAWQAGKLNGVGGKLENLESPAQAMAREYWEETGVETQPGEWANYADLQGPNFLVHVFRRFGDDGLAVKSLTDEVIEVHAAQWTGELAAAGISNLSWLIPAALDMGVEDAGPMRLVASYPAAQ